MKDNSYAFIIDCSLDKKGNIIIYELQPLTESGLGVENGAQQNAFEKAFPNKSVYIENYGVDVKGERDYIFVKSCNNITDEEFQQNYTYRSTPSKYEITQLDNKVYQRLYLPKEVSPEHLTLDLSINSDKLADQVVQYFKDKDITKIALKHPDLAVGKGNIFINDLTNKNKIKESIEQLKNLNGLHSKLLPSYLLVEEQKIFSRISRKTGEQKDGYLTFRIVGIATKEENIGYFIATKSLSEEVNSHKRKSMKRYFGEKHETIDRDDADNKWQSTYVGPKDKYSNIGERKILINENTMQEVFKSAYHLYHDIKSHTKEEFEAHIAKLAKPNNHEIVFMDPKFQKLELVEKNDFTALLLASEASYSPLIDKILKEIDYEPSDLIAIRNMFDNTGNPVLKAWLCMIGRQKDPIKKYDIKAFVMKEYCEHYNITIEQILDIAAREGYLNVIKHHDDNKNINENQEINKMLANVLAITAEESREILEFLIENGANMNAQDQDKNTPLHLAIINGRTETAKFLIEKGADIDAQDQDKNTPLHLAIINGHTEIVDRLIAAGAKINVRNEDGSTPLHLATDKGYIEIVKLLIKKGANIDIKNAKGKTFLDLVKNSDVKEFLSNEPDLINVQGNSSRRPYDEIENSDVTTLLSDLAIKEVKKKQQRTIE